MKKTILTLFIVLLVVVVHAQITFTATFSPSNLSLDTIKAADSNIYTKVKLANYYDYTINRECPVNKLTPESWSLSDKFLYLPIKNHLTQLKRIFT